MVDFVRKWKVGIGFYGEQGGESIYNAVNKLRRTYSTVQRDTDRLECMKQQLLSCHPKPKTIQPKKVKRNLKRKTVTLIKYFNSFNFIINVLYIYVHIYIFCNKKSRKTNCFECYNTLWFYNEEV